MRVSVYPIEPFVFRLGKREKQTGESSLGNILYLTYTNCFALPVLKQFVKKSIKKLPRLDSNQQPTG